jgi:hypothetical protein
MFPDAAVVRAMAARLEGDLERALNVLLELGVVGAFDPVRRGGCANLGQPRRASRATVGRRPGRVARTTRFSL